MGKCDSDCIGVRAYSGMTEIQSQGGGTALYVEGGFNLLSPWIGELWPAEKCYPHRPQDPTHHSSFDLCL